MVKDDRYPLLHASEIQKAKQRLAKSQRIVEHLYDTFEKLKEKRRKVRRKEQEAALQREADSVYASLYNLALMPLEIDPETGMYKIPMKFGYAFPSLQADDPLAVMLEAICQRVCGLSILNEAGTATLTGAEMFDKIHSRPEYSIFRNETANLNDPRRQAFVAKIWGGRRRWEDQGCGAAEKIGDILKILRSLNEMAPVQVNVVDIAPKCFGVAKINICNSKTGFSNKEIGENEYAFNPICADTSNPEYWRQLKERVANSDEPFTISNLGASVCNMDDAEFEAYVKNLSETLRGANKEKGREADYAVLGMSEARDTDFLKQDYVHPFYQAFALMVLFGYAFYGQMKGLDPDAISARMENAIASNNEMQMLLENSKTQFLYSTNKDAIFHSDSHIDPDESQKLRFLLQGNMIMARMKRREPEFYTDIFEKYGLELTREPLLDANGEEDISKSSFLCIKQKYDEGKTPASPSDVSEPMTSPAVKSVDVGNATYPQQNAPYAHRRGHNNRVSQSIQNATSANRPPERDAQNKFSNLACN